MQVRLMFSRLTTYVLIKLFPVLEQHKELIKIFANITLNVTVLIIVTSFPTYVQFCPAFNNLTGINFNLTNSTLPFNYTP